MAHYLVVAHQTAGSDELLDRVRKLANADADAQFTLLVPATPVAHLLTWVEGESRSVAAARAAHAKAIFARERIPLVEALVGDPSPVLAVGDALRQHPGRYQAIVISTFPSRISRWLQLDIVSQTKRTFGVPVIHVEAERERAQQRRLDSAS